LHEIRNAQETDLDRLSRFAALSKLSIPELTQLSGVLALSDFRRHDIVLHEAELSSDANILLRGIVRVTCLDRYAERVTIGLLGPGLIPEFPTQPVSRSDFQCEAYSDCRIGSLGWVDFNRVLLNSSDAAFKAFHENDSKQWYRLLLRSSSFSNFGLHQRIGITLLELCSEFGIEDARGTLLRISFSHQDIASLVAASRPSVTEHLERFERDHLLIRQGRQFIICADKLGEMIGVHYPNEREVPDALPGKRSKRTARLRVRKGQSSERDQKKP
jgi:CRP-like cAMP-binding protein